MKNIAIVTGATGGFGQEFIKNLLKKEEIEEIWALSKSEEKLSRLKEEYGSKIRTFAIDLSDAEQIKSFGSNLNSEITIKYLINNAGYGRFGSYEDLSIDESLKMIHLNVDGLVAMGLLCIPFMKEKSRIMNISSQASFQPLPYFNIYAAAKNFVKNYTRALNVELKSTGITAIAVCPGWMKTQFMTTADIGAKKNISVFTGALTPDKVAKKAIKDADKGKDISNCGFVCAILRFFVRILPQKSTMKLWIRMQKIK